MNAVAAGAVVGLAWFVGKKLFGGATNDNKKADQKQRLRLGFQFESRPCKVDEIGINYNEWKQPVALCGAELKTAKQLFHTDELNFKESDWNRATTIVDAVLKMLMEEMQVEVRKFEGIGVVIESYVKQGSSREGIKVKAVDEFDVLLQFHFDGFEYEVEPIKNEHGYILPELAYLRVESTMDRVSRTHQRLFMKGVFTELDDQLYIHTMNLHEKVFKSIIAAAASRVESAIKDISWQFQLKVRTNPPSVNIGIQVPDNCKAGEIKEIAENGRLRRQSVGYTVERSLNMTVIDLDMVPAIVIDYETVPDPFHPMRTMLCPKYAVFKWFTENHRSAALYEAKPALLWRLCSSGYEKHVIDVAQCRGDQLYIIKALRLLKLYFDNKKSEHLPLQVVTVLRSYHLKQLAFYCILFLRIRNRITVNSVEDALAYLLEFLKVCLEEGKLSHFFHANHFVQHMFPNFECDTKALRYNLFLTKRGDALNQARLSFKEMKSDFLRHSLISESVSNEVVRQFRDYVSSGSYYSDKQDIPFPLSKR